MEYIAICGDCEYCIAKTQPSGAIIAVCEKDHFDRPRSYKEVFTFFARKKARACRDFSPIEGITAAEIKEIQRWFDTDGLLYSYEYEE